MSIAPPGHETPQASPPPPPPAPQGAPLSHKEAEAQAGSRQAADHVQHEFKCVQAVRGRESSAKAKWQNQGWEFVSEDRGTLRTELNFRRVKPKTFGAHLLSIVATVRRMQPKTQLVLVASSALILVAGITGIVFGTQSGGDARPSSAQTTASTAPPAEPTGDEPVDFVRTHLGALDAGDAATFCGRMTDKHTKSSIAEAVEHDTIQQGSNCADMVREFVEANQFDDVDSGDANLKQISNDGTKAAVKVTYEDAMYSPYTLVLVDVDGQWLVDSEIP